MLAASLDYVGILEGYDDPSLTYTLFAPNGELFATCYIWLLRRPRCLSPLQPPHGVAGCCSVLLGRYAWRSLGWKPYTPRRCVGQAARGACCARRQQEARPRHHEPGPSRQQ